MAIKTPYYSVWEQQDGTFKFCLTNKSACSSKINGSAPTEEEAIKLAKESVSGCFTRENADRIRQQKMFLIHGKKKIKTVADEGFLPLFA